MQKTSASPFYGPDLPLRCANLGPALRLPARGLTSLAVPSVLILGLLLGPSSSIAAQDHLYTFRGDSFVFGSSVAGVGDVNKDGYADVAIGATPGEWGRVLSGKDGTVLFTMARPAITSAFDTAIGGAGDVNNDGYPDVIVGAIGVYGYGSSTGGAQIWSGKDGTMLHVFEVDSEIRSPTTGPYGPLMDSFAYCVSGAGDVNNDGYADVIIGAPYDDNIPEGFAESLASGNGRAGDASLYRESGSASVFSGKDGKLIHMFDGDFPDAMAGWDVDGVGDVNKDGFDDLIVSSMGNGGTAHIWSGQDGALLFTFKEFAMLVGVAGVGDIDKDSYPDFMVGDPMDGGTGSAAVLSGRDGSQIYKFYGDADHDHFGMCLASAGDVNNDGYLDVIVGAPGAGANGPGSGAARVFSGRDGSVLHTYYGQADGEMLGWSVDGAGDVNRDAYDDVIIGSRMDVSMGPDTGSARVFSGKALSLWSDTHELTMQVAGTQTLSIDAGPAHAGRNYTIYGSMTGTEPGTPLAGFNIPLNVDTWTLVELSYLNTSTFTDFRGRLDATGRASANINVPAGLPASLGFTLYHAYVVYNDGLVPFMVSNPVTLRLK